MASPGAPLPPDVSPGSRPGGVGERYRALFDVGRGGMGAVEVALERGREGFDRIVALKHLLPDQARDPRHKQMFLGEARLAALLRHPNVVHAFAFGDLYGELFLAMEYVEGETLARTLAQLAERSAGLEPATVAYILAHVCEGLHAAHELRDEAGTALNVVHRDVTPHNVMVAYDGHIKILDFGVAKFDSGGHESRTGEVKGKMAYMSPEQALGEPLDRRSDLYSVGAVLFECLSGRKMWGGGTDLEVMRKLALEDPPGLADAMPGAPPALVSLHARLVARSPAQRPATALDVARELHAFVGPRSAANAATVAALMRSLFAEDAARKRAELNAALAEVAPEDVDALRKTLDLATTLDSVTRTEPVLVDPKRRALPDSPPSRGRGMRAAGAALALAALVAAIGLLVRRPAGDLDARSASTSVALGEPPPVAPGPQIATTPPANVSSAPVAAAASGPPPLVPPASASVPFVPPAHAAAPGAGPGRRPTRPLKPVAVPSVKPPDVDPTPF